MIDHVLVETWTDWAMLGPRAALDLAHALHDDLLDGGETQSYHVAALVLSRIELDDAPMDYLQ